MHFESVVAYAFGPLKDQRLVLAPGMNVIWGPNEAGKSSWHAALYAGLCGIRRARGKPTNEDQRFGERHRPWDGSSWDVGAIIRLEDSRRIELRHDLAGRVSSRASDADLGRDCSDEIIMDGAPDGARWLGLDRRSFVATACVRQADLMAVLDDPGMLQEELQRAAATSGADATAASALARLEQFRAEHVGRDIASSNRPMRRAQRELEVARLYAEAARLEHARYLTLAEQIDRQEHVLKALSSRLQAAEWNREQHEILRLKQRRVAAIELARRFPDGPPSVDSSVHLLTRQAAETLEAWRQRPAERTLDGPSADELRRTLCQVAAEQPTSGRRSPNSLSRPVLVLGGVSLVFGLVAGLIGQIVLAVICVALSAGMLIWTVMNRDSANIIDAPITSDAAYRDALEREVQRREQDELDARAAAERRKACEEALRAVAERCGVTGSNDDDLALELDGWIALTHRKLSSLSDAAREFGELAKQQGEGTLDEIDAELCDRSRRLEALSPAPTLDSESPLTSSVAQLADEIGETQRRLALLQGQRLELGQALRSVAEAEERSLAAEMQLARIQKLESVLTDTQRFLTAAQDQVHRSIAPVLASSIRSRLDPITHGRYADVRVDPASLEVRVLDSGGQWREAALLSHGTAEQIYLLLRVALAEHLTRAGEVCPLILDDVTAHCDDERTIAVLDTLHVISRERQVILFSQESQVRHWAEGNLVSHRDQLEILDQLDLRRDALTPTLN